MVWSDDFAVGGIIRVYEMILYKTCRLLTAFECRRGCDRMVVGFTTTYAISAYHRISIRARCTTLCDKVCQLLTTVRWFSPGHPVSSTNTTNRHNITEILLKVALNTIKQKKKNTNILTAFNANSVRVCTCIRVPSLIVTHRNIRFCSSAM